MQINFEKIGADGPPLVLLHGWGQSLASLRPLGNLLSQSAQVFLFDLPGFGKSPTPPDVWDSKQYAAHIVEAMRAMGVERFSLLGHSFGGKIASSVAVLYPECVEKLVLLATSGLKKRRTPKFYSIRFLAKAVKLVDKLFGTTWFTDYFIPRFGSRDYKAANAMRQILVRSVNEDCTELFRCIKAPTLILWGDRDQETPREMAERLHALIPNSTLHIFPHKDHYLFDDCGSHLCAYYMRPFLRGTHG